MNESDISILAMFAMNLFFMSIVIWRVESLRDDVQDDICAIERTRHLGDSELAGVFADGSEK